MSEITDWADGKRCSRHDLAWCADCRAFAKIVRTSDGTLHYDSDCAVSTFAEVTGADYEEATEALRAAGYVPGRGTPSEGLRSAFESYGYRVTASYYRPEEAALASRTGRVFYVSGQKGRYGHAWSILDGKANRPFRPPYRYRIYEVTA